MGKLIDTDKLFKDFEDFMNHYLVKKNDGTWHDAVGRCATPEVCSIDDEYLLECFVNEIGIKVYDYYLGKYGIEDEEIFNIIDELLRTCKIETKEGTE